MLEILLGDEVRDTITGLRGVVVARYEFIHGCVRMAIQPRKLKDGKPMEQQTFDEPQLELVKEGPRHVKAQTNHPGGPHPEPARRAEPSRRV